MIPISTSDLEPAPRRTARGAQQLAGWAALLGGALVILFWVAYFSNSVALGQDDPIVRAFESAFPVADLAFAAALLAAGRALLERKRSGPFLLVVASSMSLFLGLLDATFRAQHGGGVSAIQVPLIVLCVGGGGAGLWLGWRLWSRS